MVFTTGDNNFGVAKWIVDSIAGHGTHTTIASAITSASSGDTIFIRPGTYTENLTLKAGVNLTAFECDGVAVATGGCHVNIIGKLTATYSGIVSITGIMLTTNSDFAVVASASAPQLNLFSCYLNALNNTFFSVTTASAAIYLFYCNGNLGTTGIAYISQSNGSLFIVHGFYNNTGGSTTTSTLSGGVLDIIDCVFTNPITTSGNAQFFSHYSIFEGVGNTIFLTLGSTNTHLIDFCTFNSGTASAISVSAGATLMLKNAEITSSNTNAITGAGTINYCNLAFIGTSSTINTTTQTFLQANVGKYIAEGQPRFAANACGGTGVTGDGTTYTIGAAATGLTAWTEVYDIGGNFNTNGTFTAPASGKNPRTYTFKGAVGLTGIDATNTGLIFSVVTTKHTYTGFTFAPFPISVGGSVVVNVACDAEMDTGDTAVLQITVFGAGKNVNVQASASNTYFQGRLAA